MTATACPSAQSPASCRYVLERGASVITLADGRECCSWCPAWLAETADRAQEARRILRLADRESRRAALGRVEMVRGPEHRRRLDAVILETWERARAAANAANQ